MLSIFALFTKTQNIAVSKNWDKVYVAVDVHETILESDYTSDSKTFKYYPNALDALKMLSDDPFYELILWTSCTDERGEEYIKDFEKYGIDFEYFNANPEVPNTAYADFSRKFYFNILLDDKAGFNPTEDWDLVIRFMQHKKRKEKEVEIEMQARAVHQKLIGKVSLDAVKLVLRSLDEIKLDG